MRCRRLMEEKSNTVRVGRTLLSDLPDHGANTMKRPSMQIGLGIALGAGIGIAIDAAFGSGGTWLAIGVAIGVAIGAAMSNGKKDARINSLGRE
jgi:hypothetical protein